MNTTVIFVGSFFGDIFHAWEAKISRKSFNPMLSKWVGCRDPIQSLLTLVTLKCILENTTDSFDLKTNNTVD